MKDPRGVERGRCQKCSCTAYELHELATTAACFYCNCPPTDHIDIGNRKETPVTSVRPPLLSTSSHNIIATPIAEISNSFSSTASTSFSSSASTSFSCAAPSSSENVVCVEVPSLLFEQGNIDIELEPDSDEIDECLPKKFPNKIQKALENKKVDANDASHIVRSVVTSLVNKGHTSNTCLKKAARRMAKRWSPLKCPVDPDNEGLYQKLRRRRDRENTCPKTTAEEEPASNRTESSLTPDEAKEKMKGDWESGLRDISHFRTNMAVCRNIRRADAKKNPGLQLFREYPALNILTLIGEEFQAEVGVSKSLMVAKWKSTVPHILKYFDQAKINYKQSESIGDQTVSILQNLHLVPVWANKKQVDNKTAHILDMFPANTPIDEMRPGPRDPPRLMGTGSVTEGTLFLHCYLDTEPYFSCEDPIDALCYLLSAYFLMGVKWPTYTRLPLIFLSSATIGAQKVADSIIRNRKMQDFLKLMHLM